MLKFAAGDQTITCTGGHPFWVCGKGWVKARELQAGTRFHGTRGTTPVAAPQPAGKAKTYNLVVADFHTYFVGEPQILSHDNTVSRPTEVLVPGLAKR